MPLQEHPIPEQRAGAIKELREAGYLDIEAIRDAGNNKNQKENNNPKAPIRIPKYPIPRENSPQYRSFQRV